MFSGLWGEVKKAGNRIKQIASVIKRASPGIALVISRGGGGTFNGLKFSDRVLGGTNGKILGVVLGTLNLIGAVGINVVTRFFNLLRKESKDIAAAPRSLPKSTSQFSLSSTSSLNIEDLDPHSDDENEHALNETEEAQLEKILDENKHPINSETEEEKASHKQSVNKILLEEHPLLNHYFNRIGITISGDDINPDNTVDPLEPPDNPKPVATYCYPAISPRRFSVSYFLSQISAAYYTIGSGASAIQNTDALTHLFQLMIQFWSNKILYDATCSDNQSPWPSIVLVNFFTAILLYANIRSFQKYNLPILRKGFVKLFHDARLLDKEKKLFAEYELDEDGKNLVPKK
ncbi:MAG TPA: hypothetical protein VJL60_04480, partial [Gammaproteobacteria bacterium]|nr:hypothetical protein [Gammaproteobacteria bacterium]